MDNRRRRGPAHAGVLGLWLVAGVFAAAVPGCPCSGAGGKRPYPEPSVKELIDHVKAQGDAVKSYVAQSVMDYWVGDQRVKTTVYVMGERGAKVRFNAINPATNTRSADLACDGQSFYYLNYDAQPSGCQLAGTCNQNAIAQLLRVRLEPDDFLLLAVGSTPILPQASGKVHWDSDRGAEVVDLMAADGRHQRLVLDGRGSPPTWDLLESTMVGPDGKVEWALTNKDFRGVSTDDKTVRVPGKSRFQQPQQKADLVVAWDSRTLNTQLDPSKFRFDIPAGLPRCGAKPGAGGGGQSQAPSPPDSGTR